MPHPQDQAFIEFALQAGLATPEQIAAARRSQSAAEQVGTGMPLAAVLVLQKVITPAQQETVEKKIKAAKAGIQQLGPYRLLYKLGEGGMGAVYLAEDTTLGRQVDVKILSLKHTQDHEFVARFEREARAAGQLNHPNIVGAYLFGRDQGYSYYAMEYCVGEPMDKVVARCGVIPWQQAAGLAAQVARGLQYAHDRGFIHRDIKPGNLIWTLDGVVKIMDLGLTKRISGFEVDTSYRTVSGVAVGTPNYISPEQAQGEHDLDGRTDIYSLGVTLYHLVTGRMPFDGVPAAAVLVKHISEQLPSPCDLRPEIPPPLAQVIQRMTAKNRKYRYAHCEDAARDLELVGRNQRPEIPPLPAGFSTIADPYALGEILPGPYSVPAAPPPQVVPPAYQAAPGEGAEMIREPRQARRMPAAEAPTIAMSSPVQAPPTAPPLSTPAPSRSPAQVGPPRTGGTSRAPLPKAGGAPAPPSSRAAQAGRQVVAVAPTGRTGKVAPVQSEDEPEQVEVLRGTPDEEPALEREAAPAPEPRLPLQWIFLGAGALLIFLLVIAFFLFLGRSKPGGGRTAAVVRGSEDEPLLPEEAAWKNAVNLLPQVNPNLDTRWGKWHLQNQGLLAEKGAQAAQLEIPYAPHEEYDFRITFTCLEGNLGVCQYLTKGGNGFMWAINRNLSVLACVSGAGLNANNPTAYEEDRSLLQQGRVHMMVVQVRKGWVKTYLDGKPLSKLRGGGELSPTAETRVNQKRLGVGAGFGSIMFSRLEVLEYSGKGKFGRN